MVFSPLASEFRKIRPAGRSTALVAWFACRAARCLPGCLPTNLVGDDQRRTMRLPAISLCLWRKNTALDQERQPIANPPSADLSVVVAPARARLEKDCLPVSGINPRAVGVHCRCGVSRVFALRSRTASREFAGRMGGIGIVQLGTEVAWLTEDARGGNLDQYLCGALLCVDAWRRRALGRADR